MTTRSFQIVYDEIIQLMNALNNKQNKRNKALFELMEYWCDHVNELCDFFDHRLVTIINKVINYVLIKDESLQDRFDIYLERLNPFISKYVYDPEENEPYENTYEDTFEVPSGYYIKSQKKPVYHSHMKKLGRYVSFVLMKIWPDEIDVHDIKSYKDFDIFITRMCSIY